MVRAWPWLMLAACSAQGSIELVVTAPGLDVKRVELFVGVRDEHLEQVRPEYGPLADVVWWRRDRSATDLRPFDGGSVVYQFVNGGSFADSMSAFVVVGYDANDTPVAVHSQMIGTDISDDQIDRYQFELGAAQMPPGSRDKPGVQVWGPPARLATSSTQARDADPHACVQVDSVMELGEYKDSRTGKVPTSGMIVNKGDPDCDGLIEPLTPDFECLDHEYMAKDSLVRDALICTRPSMFVSTQGVSLFGCVAGGESCSDGIDPGDVVGCAPSSYCLPKQLCGWCGSFGGCDPYGHPENGLPSIECTLHFTGDLGSSELCPAAAPFFDFGDLFPQDALACDTSPMHQPKLRIDQMGTFANPLILSNTTELAIRPAPNGTSCHFEVEPSGPMPQDSAGMPIDYLRMRVAVRFTAPQAGRGMLMPINFRFEPIFQCGSNSPGQRCTLIAGTGPDDGLNECIRTPVAPGTEVGG